MDKETQSPPCSDEHGGFLLQRSCISPQNSLNKIHLLHLVLIAEVPTFFVPIVTYHIIPDTQNIMMLLNTFFFTHCLLCLFIYLFLAVLGLRFCARAFSSCGKRGPLFIAVRGPLTVAASLVAEHRLQTRRLSNCGSRA